MTDRPIIFSAPMVRALLAGAKTQTRRVLKRNGYDLASCPRATLCDGGLIQFEHPSGGPYTCARARYAPGDRLWVRENFAMGFDHDDHDMRIGDEPKPFYAASYDGMRWYDPDRDELRDEPRWKPSIHMPRWASRLTLVVTGVRVQRLQEISEADAVAEGCWKGRATGRAYDSVTSLRLGGPGWVNARDWFADLWDSLHGAGAWDANPFVVAITFAVHKANIDAMEKAA